MSVTEGDWPFDCNAPISVAAAGSCAPLDMSRRMSESRCVGDTAQPPSVRMIQIAGSTGSRLSISSTPRERFLECELGNLRDVHCVMCTA
jgi:hypothetical protein